jgi:4-amino-4-deoxy-L-arabinose transferase-like glycosyltransferase
MIPATRPRSIPVLLFLLVWFSTAWFGSWEGNPNNATRLFTAIELVERGTARIDAWAPLTIDKAVFDGHVYLDKAPGMTLLALPAVAIADGMTGDDAAALTAPPASLHLPDFLKLRLRLAAITGPALLTAIAAVLLYDLALGLTGSIAAAAVAALGYALGSPIWGLSTTIMGHAAVAALFVIALWSIWRAGQGARTWPAMLAGVALGYAVVVEYQAVLAGGAIALWGAWHWRAHPDRGRLVSLAVAGGVVGLLPLLAYNLIAFGTPFRIGYSGVQGFEGMQQGLFGLTVPRLSVLVEILFGDRRGLIWVAPVLVPAVFGLATLTEERRTRGIGLAAVAVVVIGLLVNAAYVYWDGGNATGPRHAMAMAGVLALGLAPFWAGLRHDWQRIGVAALLALSMTINLMIAAAEIFAPPEYRFPLWSAVYDLRFRHGDLRTIPSDWWGWTTWAGLWLYLAIALPLLAMLVVRIRRGSS